jgi:magnesium transporter
MRKDLITEDTFRHRLEDKIPFIKKILANKKDSHELHGILHGLHPSEIAYLIQYLDSPYRDTFVTWLKPHFDPEIFLFLAHNLREDIIGLLSVQEIISILEVLESDDALTLFESLEKETQSIVLNSMSARQKQNFTQRLCYPEQSAGRLMQQEVLTLPVHWTVAQSKDYIAKTDTISHIYEAFIVDERNIPVGVLPLSYLIKREDKENISDIMIKEVRSIPVYWDQEEVAFVFRLYDLMSAPVVNENNEVLGMITVDDVIDVIERKATEDLLHMGRIHASDFYESVIKTSFNRIHWLIVTLINTLLTSLVINQFQETLQEKVALTILMPIAAAMGGNSGIQSATVIIRALATKELSMMNMRRTFVKEAKVALLSGSIFGILLGFVALVLFRDLNFAFILGGAIVFNMLWAGIAGTFFPIMISRLGYDPALSAGPLLTTTTDVLGYAIFLGLAQWLIR